MNNPSANPSPATQDKPAPGSASEMFWAFSFLALRGFGGVLPWAHRMLVDEKRWLSREDFTEILAFGQVLPGPNICNVALMVGDKFFGWRGALACLVGMLFFPSFVVSGLALLYHQFIDHPQVRGAMLGMGAAASGMILATGLKLAKPYRHKLAWLIPGVLAFVAIALLRRPMFETLLWLLPLSLSFAWWHVGPKSRGAASGKHKV